MTTGSDVIRRCDGVGGKDLERGGASTSQMGRFETELLATDDNLAALAQLPGMWIDRVHQRKPPKIIVLDMDSSVSPTHGEQEGTAIEVAIGDHRVQVSCTSGDLESSSTSCEGSTGGIPNNGRCPQSAVVAAWIR
jgi:hypothetical protein